MIEWSLAKCSGPKGATKTEPNLLAPIMATIFM